MATNKDEYLSALVDDEAGRFEGQRMLDEMSKHAEDREQWARYYLIGDAMRGELPPLLNKRFAAVLSQRIEAEAPLSGAGPTHGASRMAKPVIGFAMAASVAVVSVLTVQNLMAPEDVAPGSVVADGQRMGVPAIKPVVATTGSVPTSKASAEAEARLNSYFVNHSEYAARQGMLPHARVVGYRGEED